jgi:OmpA-OmpF porin, OOP family
MVAGPFYLVKTFCNCFGLCLVDLNMQTRIKTFLFGACIFFAANGFSQSKPGNKKDSLQTASVEVYVVDSKEAPRKGEMVVFSAEKKNRQYTGRTDKNGMLKTKLPVGDDYKVMMKTFSDTVSFGVLSIPPLSEGEFYDKPFTANLVYEPARQFTLDNVEFDVGKATLRPASNKELNELVEYLQWKEEQKIEVAGHTDKVGKDADNEKLSQQRAEAVKNYLLKKGIKADRIVAKGYGATEPIADNSTAEGRQKNRRTEVRLMN